MLNDEFILDLVISVLYLYAFCLENVLVLKTKKDAKCCYKCIKLCDTFLDMNANCSANDYIIKKLLWFPIFHCRIFNLSLV